MLSPWRLHRRGDTVDLTAMRQGERSDFANEDEAFDYAIETQRDRRNATSAEIFAWIKAVDKRKKQGERSDLVPCGTKSKPSRETTAEAVGVSPQTVSRARLVATDPALEPKSAPTRRRPGRPS